ncbi:DNA topoisomerase III [Mangrovibacillus cuniculi]|uniref:DNA topoisomerase 3 n=1 Tax=Mangrovibacillus cuniculi TaxID=2593652 RepID=A0A7S8HEX6_9BACI|nr:DNA topoisomerase III [Mangrovibacillus cuniculi]QPC45936.1 DNA topoisomerase III [Mangrovibacillus cuniculi]
MSKSVVLAEKPSVARDIARVLQCGQKGNGFFEGKNYIVTWALGHLVTHADPEAYGKHLQTWKLEDLPIMPDALKTIVIKKTSKQFYTVKNQLERKDVSKIIIATDAGREGELVARWIIDKAKVKKPIERLWISSVTDQAIKQGFANLKPGKAYEDLYHSAIARAEADWFVGINATRALTTKHGAQLSCGRVQTPTLAMIAAREEEIKSFKPASYWGLKAEAPEFSLTWQEAGTNQTRTFKEGKMEELSQKLKGQKSVVEDFATKRKQSFAPGLYDLTELQRDAHKAFQFSAKETLSTLQALYERHKLVTYPRTDSRFLSTDMVGTLMERVDALKSSDYNHAISLIKKNGMKASKRFVDDARVSDHHAIIPTEVSAATASLSGKEFKLYDMIVKRFLANLLPAYEFDQTTIRVMIGEETFVAKGNVTVSKGWKVIYDRDTEEEETDIKSQELPRVNKGDQLAIKRLVVTSGETKPPKRFTEGTLLSAMENPKAFLEGGEQKLASVLQKTGGLGTVATRADIIEKLFNTFLIEKRQQDIFITSKGKQLLDLAPQDLRSPALTGEWEEKLDRISKGKLSKDSFIGEMKQYTKEIVKEIKQSTTEFKHDNVTGTHCPECGKLMLEVNGKKGKMLVCQDRECGAKKNIAKQTNARCPKCHKRMVLRGEGEGQTFSCQCGYREKLSAFEKRRKNSKSDAAGKRDVAKYMKKQKKEDDEPMNSALADALKNLKL